MGPKGSSSCSPVPLSPAQREGYTGATRLPGKGPEERAAGGDPGRASPTTEPFVEAAGRRGSPQDKETGFTELTLGFPEILVISRNPADLPEPKGPPTVLGPPANTPTKPTPASSRDGDSAAKLRSYRDRA